MKASLQGTELEQCWSSSSAMPKRCRHLRRFQCRWYNSRILWSRILWCAEQKPSPWLGSAKTAGNTFVKWSRTLWRSSPQFCGETEEERKKVTNINMSQETMRWENTSPWPMIIFFNLFWAMRHPVKVIFSLGPMIAQPVPNSRPAIGSRNSRVIENLESLEKKKTVCFELPHY